MIIHTVTTGDTIAFIAAQYDTTVIQLLRNNPPLTLDSILTPGHELYITYDNQNLGDITVNGYAIFRYNWISIKIA